ncbi:hypothetical protein CSOJ01_15538 [Colletotrichum sojae]|uniref:Uncharacterized protein n=1 Tax=Colletotrichum sojae TaxID=2175907 RepID=A0A8H6IMW4_9PEZI|nr:hypothetical protein CSOJ01_15538 [Colletotrichum sojae]
MPHVTKLLFAAWAVSQAVFPAAAQSSGSSSYGQCSRGIQLIGYDRTIDFNLTGSMPFDIGDQDGWYLSYLLHDTRQEFVEWNGFPTAPFLESYISVPEWFIGSTRGNETETCMYTTRGLNKTSEAEPGSDASESCKGVLSNDCIELLRRVEGPTDGNCPNITGIEDECGFSVAAGRYTFGRCTLGHLPSCPRFMFPIFPVVLDVY